MSNQPWVYYPHRFREFNGKWLVVHNMTDPDTTVAEFNTMEEARSDASRRNKAYWSRQKALNQTPNKIPITATTMIFLAGIFQLILMVFCN